MIEVGRIPLNNVVEFRRLHKYKITLPALRIWTDPRRKSVVWKRAPSIERAVNLCYEDGDVPRHWVAQHWSRT